MCPDTVEQSQPLINITVTAIQDRLRDGESLLDVERGLFEGLLALGLMILEHAMQTLLADQDYVVATYQEARSLAGPMRSKGRARVTIKTLFGDLKVHTSYWIENLKGHRGARRQKRQKTGSGLYPAL